MSQRTEQLIVYNLASLFCAAIWGLLIWAVSHDGLATGLFFAGAYLFVLATLCGLGGAHARRGNDHPN